jgi:hypothetical protein
VNSAIWWAAQSNDATLSAVSTDFFVWRGPKLSADEFMGRLIDIDEGRVDEESAFEWSERLLRFRHEVLAQYPPLEDLNEGGVRSSPWAFTPSESARFIELNFRSSAPDEQFKFVLLRALRMGLFVYAAPRHEIIAPGLARWQRWLHGIGLERQARH